MIGLSIWSENFMMIRVLLLIRIQKKYQDSLLVSKINISSRVTSCSSFPPCNTNLSLNDVVAAAYLAQGPLPIVLSWFQRRSSAPAF